MRHSKPNGVLLWEGISELDNKTPIMAIMTGTRRPTHNPKTGIMRQVWILLRDTHPVEATKTGIDSAICGDCPLRPANSGACYVTVSYAASKIWKYHKEAGYPQVTTEELVKLRKTPVRLGAYGDPAACPFDEVRTWVGKSWTGYTHQWKTCDKRFSSLCMASCDNLNDFTFARALGWLPFCTVQSYDTVKTKHLMPCLNTVGTRLQCADCGLCCGKNSNLTRRFEGIMIEVHGIQKDKFSPTHHI